MTAIDLLRPPVRRARRWMRRHNGWLVADLERRYDLNQLQRFEVVLNRHGRSFRTCSSILDFGCGVGRLTRHLATLAPAAAVVGCDISREGIAACRRRHPAWRFIVNEAAPPLDGVADGTFDLIFSYSVFTHLSGPNHKAWLRELARLLRPGGVMLHTVHSYAYLRRTAFFSPESLEKYQLGESIESFIRSGREYLYVVEDPGIPEYGNTVMRKEYVLEMWPRETGLAVLDFVEGAIESYPEGCQDLVLLGPRT